MFAKTNGPGDSRPQRKRTDKESPSCGPATEKSEKEETSSFEQFQEQGYDSGFVYHEE